MTAAEEAEAQYNKLHPPAAAAPAPADNTAPSATAPPGDAEATYQKLHPPPTPSDEDILGSDKWNQHNFWNLPPGVSQSDYWGAEGRKIGSVASQAAADTGLIFGDDMSFGTPGITGVPGQSPEDYRAAVQAARDRAGGGKYGIDAMAFLANKPFQAARFGLRAGQLAGAGIKAAAPQVAKDTVKAIARRVGSFVEGGAYTGAQSAGHGGDVGTVAADTAAGGVLGSVLDEGFNAAKEYVAPWLRSTWGGFQGKPLTPGTPEGTPVDIAAGPPPGAPPRTAEQAMDANQMNLWRSQSKLTSPPSQADVGNYATKVYGDDPANWPAALRDIHSAAGKEGAPSTAARIIGHGATQAIAGVGNYLGLGFSPEVAAIAHPALASATEMALPALGYGAAPVKSALANAYPALTGWRNAPNTPDWRY